jgi:ATP-dependent Clp protease protease subunit
MDFLIILYNKQIMQHSRDYLFAVTKKKKQPKRPKEDEESLDDDPLEQFNNLFKPQTSMDREKNHIYFYQSVDQDSCLELNRKINALNKDLMQHAIEYETEPPNIYLHINSFGGSLFAAFSTIDTIMSSKIPIVSIIEGCAASAATIISMVCHKRYCTPNSFMLIHQLSTGASGKYEEMKDDFMNDTKLMKLLYKLYLQHTNMDKKTIKKVLKRDLWWDVNECMKNGLIDDIWHGSRLNLNIEREFGSEHFSTKQVADIRNLKRKNTYTETDTEADNNSDSDSNDETNSDNESKDSDLTVDKSKSEPTKSKSDKSKSDKSKSDKSKSEPTKSKTNPTNPTNPTKSKQSDETDKLDDSEIDERQSKPKRRCTRK